MDKQKLGATLFPDVNSAVYVDPWLPWQQMHNHVSMFVSSADQWEDFYPIRIVHSMLQKSLLLMKYRTFYMRLVCGREIPS